MIPSIDERLRRIRNSAVRVEGCLRAINLDESSRVATSEELIAAALEDVTRIDSELTWFHNVPADVRATPVPTDDERNAATRGKK